MRNLLAFAVVAATATGCSQSVRTVEAMRVAGHAGELVRDGEVTIAADDGTPVTVRGDEVVNVRIADADGLERPARLTVHTLVEGCVDDVTAPACLAGHLVDRPLVRRRKTRVDPDKIVGAVAIGALGSLAGYCLSECEDGPGEVARGT